MTKLTSTLLVCIAEVRVHLALRNGGSERNYWQTGTEEIRVSGNFTSGELYV